jgi:hypothetical protein
VENSNHRNICFKTEEEKEIMPETIHILHDQLRTDRYDLLMQEVQQQGFDYRLWDACHGEGKPKKHINACHKKIVQFAKDNNMPEIILGEDDMHWTAQGAFDYFIEHKPDDFDIYLSSIMWGRINGENEVSDFAGFQCAIIHQRFYDTFLAADPNTDIDRAMKGKGKFIVVNPFCTIQHETFSDNTKRIHSNQKLYHDRKLYGQ